MNSLLIFPGDAPLGDAPTRFWLRRLELKPGISAFQHVTDAIRAATENDPLLDCPTVITNYGPIRAELGPLHHAAHRAFLKFGGDLVAAEDLLDFSWSIRLELAARLRRRQYPPALDPAVANIAGHVGDAKALLVGEEIRKIYGWTHWPFHADVGCAVYLNECLERANIPSGWVACTNIIGQENHVSAILQFNPQLQVVALGNKAAAGLAALNVPFVKIPHPQHARRFQRRTLDYATLLRQVIAGSSD
jgi:hypothetical protein